MKEPTISTAIDELIEKGEAKVKMYAEEGLYLNKRLTYIPK